MSTTVTNAFLFYDVIIFVCIAIGVYYTKNNPILGFANGAIAGLLISIILYNFYKDKLSY